MTAFREGWYEIHFDPKTYRSRCRYFRTMSFYTAECTIESNGQQFLLWQDPNGPKGAGRPAEWSSSYKPLPDADKGDWWDNPPGGTQYKPAQPGHHSRTLRKPTPRELCQRAGSADAASGDGLSCTKEIHVGIFFDGTNNNMKRDKPVAGHSNIVSLFDAHKLDNVENFAYYLPGVGTPFPEVGEMGESRNGKAFSEGGEQRIHYAMLQVYNAACRAATGMDLMQPDEMKGVVNSSGGNGLATWWRLGDAKMNAIFERIDARLMKAIEGKRPRVTKLNLSVFGFSRGAAEARVFNKWIQQASRLRVGTAVLNLRFLGIFDTVASVFLADSSPVGSGFFDWASGNLDVVGVQRTAHFVAAHEIRRSFPLSTARSGKTYGAGVKEYVYPGAHSDVGGGYGPGSQGKSTGGHAALLSQIPLNDMFFEALNGGAALLRLEEMPVVNKADFRIDPKLDTSFSAYAAWTVYEEKEDVAASKGDAAENRMQYHTHLYWRWRARVSPDATFKALSSYAVSGAQDKIDLWESELDWRADVERARQASKPGNRFVPRVGYVDVPPSADAVQTRLLAETGLGNTVPEGVGEFFDKFVHDSHGGFWMLGPQTKVDRAVFIQEIKDKRARHEELLAHARSAMVINPLASLNFLAAAKAYELNRFERRVLDVDTKTPGEVPLMTDADAGDLRRNAGIVTSASLKLVGTATRREPHGHGRYRRVFDQS